MNHGIQGWQDTGKTALMIGCMLEDLGHHGYSAEEVVTNMEINLPGIKWIKGRSNFRRYLMGMVENDERHKIVMIDEADRILPARFWHNVEQTEALLDFMQDEKLFNRVYWTAHFARGVDINLRNSSQIQLEPHFYNEISDSIPFDIFDLLDGEVGSDELLHVRERIFPIYDRWGTIKRLDQKPGKEGPVG